MCNYSLHHCLLPYPSFCLNRILIHLCVNHLNICSTVLFTPTNWLSIRIWYLQLKFYKFVVQSCSILLHSSTLVYLSYSLGVLPLMSTTRNYPADFLWYGYITITAIKSCWIVLYFLKNPDKSVTSCWQENQPTMSTRYLVVIYTVTAGLHGDDLGSDEAEVVQLTWAVVDVQNCKVGDTVLLLFLIAFYCGKRRQTSPMICPFCGFITLLFLFESCLWLLSLFGIKWSLSRTYPVHLLHWEIA